jgi:hypothetical protein
LRFVETIDAVEQGGLAGTVRPDDGQYLSIPDIQAHVNKGFDAAKTQ